MNKKAKDPVCGSIVDTMFTSRRHSLGNAEYYFCSDACMSRFLTEPGKYAGTPGAT
ncbi:MAG TPA: YHS domain-containing protein [Planctomycetota bacterium]|nr:YHS domain-containing protein [Planctomycetota bacterium]